jgi:hypothetical protein
MSERPWWSVALQWTVWGVVMALVMSWLGKSRLRRRVHAEAGVLRHPRSTLIMGILCFGFFAALTVLSNLYPNNTATWWTTAIFVGFALMSAPMVIEFFVVRHEVSDEGLAYRKLFGQRGVLRWSELRTVRYGATMKWFRLETQHGVVVRISAMLMGLPEFARALLRGAPAGSIDSAALAVLEETAAGNPPSLWG